MFTLALVKVKIVRRTCLGRLGQASSTRARSGSAEISSTPGAQNNAVLGSMFCSGTVAALPSFSPASSLSVLTCVGFVHLLQWYCRNPQLGSSPVVPAIANCCSANELQGGNFRFGTHFFAARNNVVPTGHPSSSLSSSAPTAALSGPASPAGIKPEHRVV